MDFITGSIINTPFGQLKKQSPIDVSKKDLMQGYERWEFTLHNHGILSLVEVTPRFGINATGDHDIAEAARISYGKGTKKNSSDRDLIRYLYRHRHTSPFEMPVLRFYCKLPIFVARQWIRHRTASVNEYSLRYSESKNEFYFPEKDAIKYQSKTNKQGRDEVQVVNGSTLNLFSSHVLEICHLGASHYESAIADNIARETGRIVLPTALYTEWYWQCNLHNLFHFLKLRMDKHAQLEIRDYANRMYEIVNMLFPFAAEAFSDYDLNAIILSRLEIDALREKRPINGTNKREIEEFEEKKRLLGLI